MIEGCVDKTKSAAGAGKLLAFLLLLQLGSTGCSSFNHAWRKAGSAPSQGIEGRWDGTWSSSTNGHRGRLRGLLTRNRDGGYLARFHANYLKIFRFTYTVPLTVREADGSYQFDGSANLGRLAGGRYQYEGRATPTNFFSTYQAKADGGIFEMKRPPASE